VDAQTKLESDSTFFGEQKSGLFPVE